MCIVCIEVAKGKLNRSEARRALAELALDPEQEKHVQEVIRSLNKTEQETKKILPPGQGLPSAPPVSK